MSQTAARPFEGAAASTVFLRIARTDWTRIICGQKRVFREQGRWAPMFSRVDMPIPVVGWSVPGWGGAAEYRMLVVEENYSQPLGAISAEELAEEGFSERRDFKRYWRNRHQRTGFRPLGTVQVYRLRPFTPADVDFFARRLLARLYGPFIEPPIEQTEDQA